MLEIVLALFLVSVALWAAKSLGTYEAACDIEEARLKAEEMRKNER